MNLVMDTGSNTRDISSVQNALHRRQRHSPLARNPYHRNRRVARADGGIERGATSPEQPRGFANGEQRRKAGRALRSSQRGEAHPSPVRCATALLSSTMALL
jgi:hypothetical protein